MDALAVEAEESDMEGERLRECLDIIGWSGQELAKRLETNERQVRRWRAGAHIPPQIAAWIEKLAKFHERNPPPPKVDRRFNPEK